MRILKKLIIAIGGLGESKLVTFKRIMPVTGAVLILFLFSATAVADEGTPYEYIEEDADMVLANDEVITGDVNNYSENTITLDGAGYYSFCRGVKVFSKNGATISFKDIDAAERAKIFIDKNRNCVRKITILRFAH